MTILIVGCNGFIGSSLVTYFNGQGFDVSGCDLAASSTLACTYHSVVQGATNWNRFFQNNRFDYCINAAGSGNVGYSVQHPLADFEANTVETARLLDALRLHNPACRYLHISSAAVYGNPASLPVSELAPCQPLSPYGWHKWLAESLCREYVSLYALPIAMVRPFSIYGPGLRKQLFWDTYQKYLANPDHIELWGTGRESRDFIFIDDVGPAFHMILEKGSLTGEVYNLASGTETTIQDAVHSLFRHAGLDVSIRFNQQVREGDPLNWRADVSRLSALGFQAQTNLETGIRQLASWLRMDSAH